MYRGDGPRLEIRGRECSRISRRTRDGARLPRDDLILSVTFLMGIIKKIEKRLSVNGIKNIIKKRKKKKKRKSTREKKREEAKSRKLKGEGGGGQSEEWNARSLQARRLGS